MSLFDSATLKSTLAGAATSLFNQYSPVQLAPAGTKPVQATLPATRTGTPAQDPDTQSGRRTTDTGTAGLFGGISPALLVVGVLVSVAAIVLIARR